MWDLSSLTGDQTHVPCIARQILNHWTTREVPWPYFNSIPIMLYGYSVAWNIQGVLSEITFLNLFSLGWIWSFIWWSFLFILCDHSFHISGFPQCQVILFYLFVFKNVAKNIMIMCFVYRRKVYTLIIMLCFRGSRLGASHQLGALKQGKKVLLLGSSSLLFPDGSDGKESACNAGDLALILESRRSPGEGNGNPF